MLILPLAIDEASGVPAGDFSGKTGVDNTTMPRQFRIDYVRVYQKP